MTGRKVKMKNPLGYIDGSVVLENEKYDKSINSATGIALLNKTELHITDNTAPQAAAVTVAIKEKARNRYAYRFIKRAFDIVASFFGMVLLAPLFLVIIAAIKIESEGKVVYSQRRVGRNGKVFRMYKFRSMVHNADEILMNFTPEQRAEFEVNFKLENDPRITKVGGFLRRTSLDELPQLINILRGNLSVVGPRPIVEYETYKFGDYIEKLLEVKPGLTGYWQVSGRSDTTYEERVQMEMHYVDNRSTFLDLKIFFYTFISVLKRDGAV
jgi:lipopolysaccharide/colanic/teichoic acid biosynthesis glycosyltransferase